VSNRWLLFALAGTYRYLQRFWCRFQIALMQRVWRNAEKKRRPPRAIQAANREHRLRIDFRGRLSDL
jgi:hypothetical protein